MAYKPSRNQVYLIVLLPALTLMSGWAFFTWFGTIGLVVPMTIVTAALTYLLVELRNFELGLFVKRHNETRRSYDQLEAIIGLNSFLGPALPLPATRGWAASPDFLREIVGQLMTEPAQLVVEASSGTSTLVIGYCMKKLGRGKVISLEHDEYYAERSLRSIMDHGLEDVVTVVHAPLVDHVQNGQKLLWYDLTRAHIPGPIDLLVVDGPPNTEMKMARYPAVPLLSALLSKHARILLDDGGREDETATARRWASESPGSSLEYLDLEAGAWLIRLGAFSK